MHSFIGCRSMREFECETTRSIIHRFMELMELMKLMKLMKSTVIILNNLLVKMHFGIKLFAINNSVISFSIFEEFLFQL